MTCKDIERILPGYVDEALSPVERARVEEHLAACPPCRAALADLRRVVGLEKDLEEVDAPPWLAPKIMARVRAESDRRRGIIGRLFFPLHIKLPLEALAMICVAMLVVAVFRAGGPEVQRLALNPIPPAQQSQRAGGSEAPERALQPAQPNVPPHVRMPDDTTVLHEQMAPASPTGSVGTQGSHFSTPAGKGDQEERIATPAQTAPSLPEQQAPRAEKAAEALPPSMVEKKDKQEKPVVSDTAEPTAMRSRAPQTAASLRAESSPASLDTLKITVPDINAAAKKVEELLRAFHAQDIERQAEAGTIILTAHLRTVNMPAFLARLKLIGDLTGASSIPREPGDVIPVRVEIVPSE